MTQGGYQVILILPIKSKMAAAKKQCFLRFLYCTEPSPPSFKVRGLQMTINVASHFVIFGLFQNGVNKNQHQDSYQRETIPDKFVFFFPKLVLKAKKKKKKKKKKNRVSKKDACM